MHETEVMKIGKAALRLGDRGVMRSHGPEGLRDAAERGVYFVTCTNDEFAWQDERLDMREPFDRDVEAVEEAMDRFLAMMPDLAQRIELQLRRGRDVLVHCTFGRNRSVAVVLAFLMAYRRWTLDEASAALSAAGHGVSMPAGPEVDGKQSTCYQTALRTWGELLQKEGNLLRTARKRTRFLSELESKRVIGVKSPALFDPGCLRYAYAPSALVHNGKQYLYYCSNKEPGVVRDHVYCRVAERNRDGKWEYLDESLQLSPGPAVWDAAHVCDPEVVGGEFRHGRTCYRWAMFYTGAPHGETVVNHVGVAFATSPLGPWVRVLDEPIVWADGEAVFGVGQPSATRLDAKKDGPGGVMLFYSRGVRGETALYYEALDLSDLSHVRRLKPRRRITTRGLQLLSGACDPMLCNAAVAYYPGEDRFLVAREGHPHPRAEPSWISGFVQLATLSGKAMWDDAQRGEWSVLHNLRTPYPRTHNPGLARTGDGHVLEGGGLDLFLSTSLSGPHPECLWTYRIAPEARRLGLP